MDFSGVRLRSFEMGSLMPFHVKNELMIGKCGRGGRQVVMAVLLLLTFVIVSYILLPSRSDEDEQVLLTSDQMKVLWANLGKDAFQDLSSPEKHDTQTAENAPPQSEGQEAEKKEEAEKVEGPRERSDKIRQHIDDTCGTFNISLPLGGEMLNHMHYDDKHKAIYCFVPKVACTSWKRVWMKMTGVVAADHNLSHINRYRVHTSLPLLSSQRSRLPEMMATYKKFLFVRHPFDRVLSAYKDKLEGNDKQSGYNFHKEIGERIEKKYRGTSKGGHNVTFSEFLRFISEPVRGTPEQRNEHWLSVHELCNPCAVKYDFIGKYETLKEDADYVLEWLGVSDLIKGFPASDRPMHALRYDAKYFGKLDHQEKMAFFMKYLADFVAFDYDFVR